MKVPRLPVKTVYTVCVYDGRVSKGVKGTLHDGYLYTYRKGGARGFGGLWTALKTKSWKVLERKADRFYPTKSHPKKKKQKNMKTKNCAFFEFCGKNFFWPPSLPMSDFLSASDKTCAFFFCNDP